MKKFLLLLLLLLPLTSAQVDPKLVGSAVVSLQLSWDIGLNEQTPQSASFTSFSFLNTTTQTVSFTASKPFTSSTDEFGNALLTFEIDPSQPQQRVSIDTEIRTFPEAGFDPVQEDLSKYLQPSQYVIITPAIAAKAREIVGSETNPFKKAALLTSWVHNNIAYDLAYQDSILDSTQVFEIRRGVCNEFTHLLIAMLRSEGIPTRFAAGFVYSGEIWAAHAWAEAAINGKWIPLDATYNEAILIDATHLKFASGIDQANVTEKFSARGNVDLSRISLTRSHEATFITNESFSRSPLLALFITNKTLGANALENVTVSIQSTYPDPVVYPLSLDVPAEVQIVSDKTALLMLFPGEKRNFSWVVLTPSNLQEGFIYSYPMIIRSLGSKVQGLLQAQKSDSQLLSLLQVREVRFQGNTLIVTVRNIGNAAFTNMVSQVSLSHVNQSQSFSLEAGRETQLSFQVGALNLSSRITGNLSFTSENFSFAQQFALEPSQPLDPARPAFNIQASKTIEQPAELLDQYEQALLYGAAIVLILLAAIIIKRLVRS